MQVGVVEQVPKEEWKLVKPKGRQSGLMEADPTRLQSTGAPPSDLDATRLIQSLADSTFDSVCVDSGAGESVCPIKAFPSCKTVKTVKTGTAYRAAGGHKLHNVGEIKPRFKSGGVAGSMAFQATTDVKKPLASASRITAKGNRIVLDDATHESYIENKASGFRIPLRIENGVYIMEMAVTPFQGQTN